MPIFTLLPAPLPELASSDLRKHQSHQGIAVVQIPRFHTKGSQSVDLSWPGGPSDSTCPKHQFGNWIKAPLLSAECQVGQQTGGDH